MVATDCLPSGSLGHTGTVRSNTLIAPDAWLLEIECPELAASVLPGQFVMVRCRQSIEPLLSRAFSVCDVLVEDGRPVGISVLQVVIGRGTGALAERQPGEPIGLLGPLGRAYDLGSPDEHLLLVAGGVGAAPFLYVARALKERDPARRVTYLIGARGAEHVYLADEIAALGCDVEIATDDGSAGHHGYVTDLVRPHLGPGTRVLACGPNPMFKSLARVVAQAREDGLEFPCEVSTEETMPCGYGACAGCVVPVHADDTAEGLRWVKSCLEGPVFPIERIRWEHVHSVH